MVLAAARIKDLNALLLLYRLVPQKLDPNNKQTKGVLLRDIRAMQGERSKTVKDTANTIQKLDSWEDEFEEKTGESPDMEEINLVLWQVVDDKTHDLVINKGFEQVETEYAEVTQIILAQIRRG